MTIRRLATATATISTLTTITFPGAVSAESCPTIKNDLDRLACYDKEAGLTPTQAGTTPVGGDWNVQIEKSEFKDTTDVFATLQSENALTCRNYGTPKKATLYLRCSEKTTAVYISTDCHLASGVRGYGQVEYRFGEKPASVREFDASTNNSALGLWSGSKAIPFIKAMEGSDRAIFRFTPYGQSKVVARFDITGIKEAIAPLRKECGW
ncbi:type VI secretion-associated protein, family (plasmid) [Phaeobacter inhibens]|uniref:Type VI secretion-associated protein, family n=1 Tax=Phaeobacter inhibens TaxID=221822 RepID=A0ABM6RLF8_9RHOB|nr:type VI secretion system-associated protein TagO [Phaeobacter inhibens]AUQ93844.1 type VI secretion-associated protein, family [Phaeobacter inhibens]AUQ97413.1 type VI secretion-associated protein, family [Phaeobacter inhibens]